MHEIELIVASNDKFKRIVERLLKEAKESASHVRLKGDLAAWAKIKGFTVLCSKFPDGSIPDVLLRHGSGMLLFVGDAKNSHNETTDNGDTLGRILNYFMQFSELLGRPYAGGYLALATDNAFEARRWAKALNILAGAAGIATVSGGPPNFRVIRLVGKNTWIVYW